MCNKNIRFPSYLLLVAIFVISSPLQW